MLKYLPQSQQNQPDLYGDLERFGSWSNIRMENYKYSKN